MGLSCVTSRCCALLGFKIYSVSLHDCLQGRGNMQRQTNKQAVNFGICSGGCTGNCVWGCNLTHIPIQTHHLMHADILNRSCRSTRGNTELPRASFKSNPTSTSNVGAASHSAEHADQKSAAVLQVPWSAQMQML